MTEKESAPKKAGRHVYKSTKQRKRRRWPWIVLIIALVLVAVPAGLFAYAYSQYNVPEPKELQANQVSTIVAGDGTTQLAKLVPPEGNRTQVKLDEVPTTSKILCFLLRTVSFGPTPDFPSPVWDAQSWAS